MQTKGRNYFWGRSLLNVCSAEKYTNKRSSNTLLRLVYFSAEQTLFLLLVLWLYKTPNETFVLPYLEKRMFFQNLFCPIVTFIWSKKCIELMNNSTSFTLKRGKEIWDYAKSKKKFSVRVVLQGGGGVVFIEEGEKIYGFPSESTTRI